MGRVLSLPRAGLKKNTRVFLFFLQCVAILLGKVNVFTGRVAYISRLTCISYLTSAHNSCKVRAELDSRQPSHDLSSQYAVRNERNERNAPASIYVVCAFAYRDTNDPALNVKCEMQT